MCECVNSSAYTHAKHIELFDVCFLKWNVYVINNMTMLCVLYSYIAILLLCYWHQCHVTMYTGDENEFIEE